MAWVRGQFVTRTTICEGACGLTPEAPTTGVEMGGKKLTYVELLKYARCFPYLISWAVTEAPR